MTAKKDLHDALLFGIEIVTFNKFNFFGLVTSKSLTTDI